MCGRFALFLDEKTIKETFNVPQLPLFSKRYNITPSQDILCIRNHAGEREAEMMHWGLIPFWANDNTISRKLINARAETADTKPAFRNAFKTHRGLVVMSGFYEWKRISDKKEPFYFKHPDESPIAVAALWETWQDKESCETVQSCCLLTTTANDMMRPVHDRMPVILNKAEQAAWLNHDTFNKSALMKILKPCANNELTKYPVTIKVNNPRFDDKEAVKPK